jgi:hypothetical protein
MPGNLQLWVGKKVDFYPGLQQDHRLVCCQPPVFCTVLAPDFKLSSRCVSWLDQEGAHCRAERQYFCRNNISSPFLRVVAVIINTPD